MADLASSITVARNAGYSDADITAYLAKDPTLGPQVDQARKSGYSDGEVVAYLASQKPKKPDMLTDVAKSYVTGLKQGGLGIADQVADAVPGLSQVHRAASDIWNAAHGRSPSPNATIFSDVGSTVVPDHTPETTAGKFARTAGQFTPAAVGGEGSALARVANVVVPAVASETAGQVANHYGASPQVEQVARVVGALGGGAASSARLVPKVAPTADEAVANVYAKRAGADPDAMAAKAAEMRSAGVEPTLNDVTGAKGQRLVRAVGVTNDDAGETLVGNAAKVSATTKPAVMARTRNLSAETRTADQLASDLEKARGTEAKTTYGNAYENTFVEVPDTVKEMLADSSGRSIIARARQDAIENQDWGRQVELDKLLKPTEDGQLPQISAATLDRLQIAARERGAKFAAQGNGLRAKGAFERRDQINALLDNVDGLQDARGAYRAKSQALDLLTKPGARKDPFSTDPTDYQAWVADLSPEAKHANQVAIRQDILDTLGGQRSGTAGSIDELATSQYARHNLTHALGDKEASAYLDNLTARLAQKSNSSFVSPNAGSRTGVLENDTAKAIGHTVNAIGAVKDVATLNGVGLLARTAAYLKTRGLSDAQAQELAKASVDTSRLNGVISALQKLKGPKEAKAFLTFRGGLVGQLRAATASRKPLPAPTV